MVLCSRLGHHQVYFKCNREIHEQADPCTTAALGHYLDAEDMVDEALKLCIAELWPDNFIRTSQLFQFLKNGTDQGLVTLTNWIQKENCWS